MIIAGYLFKRCTPFLEGLPRLMRVFSGGLEFLLLKVGASTWPESGLADYEI